MRQILRVIDDRITCILIRSADYVDAIRCIDYSTGEVWFTGKGADATAKGDYTGSGNRRAAQILKDFMRTKSYLYRPVEWLLPVLISLLKIMDPSCMEKGE
jgi:hypothetical protein